VSIDFVSFWFVLPAGCSRISGDVRSEPPKAKREKSRQSHSGDGRDGMSDVAGGGPGPKTDVGDAPVDGSGEWKRSCCAARIHSSSAVCSPAPFQVRPRKRKKATTGIVPTIVPGMDEEKT
jgi:hypothetical protein